jgi:hypothetical protein
MSSIGELSRFAAAHLRLLLAVDCRPLREVEVYVDDEDPKHVSIYVPDGNGHWAVACFELDEPTTEDEFDPAPWIAAIEGTHLEG